MGTVSFTVQTWRDPRSGAVQTRVVRVDREEEVTLPATSFLLRIPVDDGDETDPGDTPRRCYIRHIPTAREAFVQGGPDLYAFIQHCLLVGNSDGDAESEHPPTSHP